MKSPKNAQVMRVLVKTTMMMTKMWGQTIILLKTELVIMNSPPHQEAFQAQAKASKLPPSAPPTHPEVLPKTMHQNKEDRRVSEASSRSQGTTSSKTVMDYEGLIGTGQGKSSAAKDQRLQEMTAKLKAMEKKSEQLEQRDRRSTALLAFARENPEALIQENSTKGNKKRASSENTDDLTNEEDDEDDEEDGDSDEDASVVEKTKAKPDKDMVAFGNSAIVSVFPDQEGENTDDLTNEEDTATVMKMPRWSKKRRRNRTKTWLRLETRPSLAFSDQEVHQH